jgi:methylmalonyl-CoA mutase, N-terminal domain
LGGSYFVESLTNEIERQATAYIAQIRELGGVIPCIRNGFFSREIAEASYRYQQEVDARDRIIVGVNDFIDDAPTPVPTLYVDMAKERIHLERLARIRTTRDNERVGVTLAALRAAATQPAENTMPYILDAVRAYATLGEIMDVFRAVFGDYTEAPLY